MKKPNMTREQWEAITPPVNESWSDTDEEWKTKIIIKYGSNVKKSPFLHNSLIPSLIKDIKKLLSTARQEERERAKQVVIETMYKMDRVAGMGNIIKAIDSITSKGGK